MRQGTAIRDIRTYVDHTALDLADGQTIILDQHDVELLEEKYGTEYECQHCGTAEGLSIRQPGLH